MDLLRLRCRRALDDAAAVRMLRPRSQRRQSLPRLCARAQPSIDGIRACSRFEGAVRQAVHRLKYDGQRALAEPLAGFLTKTVHALSEAEAIVAVPLHPSRERQRGYNQSALLARALGQRLGLPVVEPLSRVRNTDNQVGLDRRQRQENVKGAFACPRPGARPRPQAPAGR